MKEELMKLVHYFVINQKYEAINIKGIKDEIWLQNFKNTFKIIRIVDKEINSKEELDKAVKENTYYEDVAPKVVMNLKDADVHYDYE